jgi:hypothetical protein
MGSKGSKGKFSVVSFQLSVVGCQLLVGVRSQESVGRLTAGAAGGRGALCFSSFDA